jgi:hypothetical protein
MKPSIFSVGSWWVNEKALSIFFRGPDFVVKVLRWGSNVMTHALKPAGVVLALVLLPWVCRLAITVIMYFVPRVIFTILVFGAIEVIRRLPVVVNNK